MSSRRIIPNGRYRGIELVTPGARKCLYPPGLIHLWSAQYSTRSRVGTPLTYSSAGSVTDGRGSLTTGPPIHKEGLWCGPAYTNLLPSEAVSPVNWIGAGITVDGDMLRGTAGTDEKYLTLGYGSIVSSEHTIRIYLKYAGFQWVRIGFGAEGFVGSERNAWFDVQNGSLGTVQNNVVGTITPASDGGYICTVKATASASVDLVAQLCLVLLADEDGGFTATGDGIKGVIARDPQVVHTGYTAYPYIPPGTTSASAAGTAGGNGAAFKTSIELGETCNEFWINPSPVNTDANNTATYDPETGICRIVSDGTAFVYLESINALIYDGLEYVISYEEMTNTAGSVKLVTADPNIAFDKGSSTYLFTPTQRRIIVGRTGGVCDVTFRISVKRVVPSPLTIALFTTIGVSSEEVSATFGPNLNYISSNNTESNLLYFRANSTDIADVFITRSFDGSKAIGQPGISWGAKSSILVLVQVSTDGLFFRTGYKNITQGDVQINFSSWQNYDGSFNPLENVRIAFGSIVPLWIKELQIWKEQVTEEKIKEVSTYAI